MLHILRTRAQSIIVQVLVGIIALVFIFWGVGSNMGNSKNVVATVNGTEISLIDFQRQYEKTMEDYRTQFGGQIPDGLLEGLNLKGQVLGQMIQTELLRQGGAAMGLSISREEARATIKEMAAFRENGAFNMDRYKIILGQNQMSPSSFEKDLQNDLLTRRTAQAVEQFAGLTGAERAAWKALGEEELRLAWAAFPSSRFEDKVPVDEAALAAWFEQRKEQYRSEPQIRLDYLVFNFSDDRAGIHIDDAAIQAKYEAEKDRFTKPEQRHARHILFRIAGNATDEQKKTQRAAAEKVLAKVRSGQDFAGLARQFSEDSSRQNGGDLGFFPRGAMVPAFENAVFSMDKGEISDLIETPFGLHIIRLEAIQPAAVITLQEARETLVSELQQQQAQAITFKRAGTAYEDIMRAGSLENYREKKKETIHESELFTKSAPPKGILSDPKLLERAFALKEGELSPIIELDSGYAILYVKKIEAAAIPELNAVREKVVADYRKEQAVDLARAAANQLHQEIQKQGFDKAVESSGIEVQTSDFIKRNKGLADKDLPPQLLQQAFSLPWNKNTPETIFSNGNSFLVYAVIERKQEESSPDDATGKLLTEQLQAGSRNRLLGNWLSGLQQQAKIWTNEQLMKN